MEESANESTHVSSRGAGLTIRWSWLSMGLGVVALCSLGTLAVVASVQGADTLSTVALALAVLAFVAQLIVSLAQGMAGAQQLAQAERINASTQSTLSSLQSATEALLATQKDQFAHVLHTALRGAVPEAVQETGASIDDQVALQDAIVKRVEESLRSLVPQPRIGVSRPSYSPTWKVFGHAMRNRRQELNMSQQDLAAALNISVAHVSSLEGGLTKPRLFRASEVDEALSANGELMELGRTGARRG